MVKEIIRYPNSILRKKCREVEEVTEEIKNLSWNMVETMTENQGIGLAALQVGELKRVIVVHLIQERTPEEKAIKSPQIFINPKIIKKSKEEIIEEEGCLSFPELFLKIKRAKEIEIEALNLNGEKIQIKAEGLLARVFQHEIDHLDGVLFIDRVGAGRRIWELLKFYIKSEK